MTHYLDHFFQDWWSGTLHLYVQLLMVVAIILDIAFIIMLLCWRWYKPYFGGDDL